MEKRYQNVSEKFKQECRADVGQYEKTGKIHVIEDNIDITGNDNLVEFSVEDNCYVNDKFIGTTVCKKITVNILNPNNQIDIENKEISVHTGMIINNAEEIVPFGNFIIAEPDTKEVKEKTNFTGYDYMIKFNVPYKNRVTYPIPAGELFEDVCEQAGVEVGSTSFVNSNYMILGNPFTNNEDCRTVVSNIAQLAGGFAKIGRDNKAYIKSLKNISNLLKVKDVNAMTVKDLNATLVKLLSSKRDNADEALDGNNYLEDFSKNNQWGEINSLILKVSGTEGENTTIQDENSMAKNGLTEVIIEDNYFLINQAEREKVINPLWDSLKGIKYLPFKTEYYGYPYLDSGDLIYIQDTKDKGYISYVFNHTFTFNGGYSGKLETPAMTKTQTAYKNTINGKTKFRQIERRIDKINGVILDVIEEQTETSQKLTQVEQTVDGITQKVQDIENLTKTTSGYTTVTLENCLEGGQVVEIHIYGNNTVFKYTRFSSNTIFGEAIFNGNSNISVTNKDGIKKIYDLGVKDVLRQNEETCDEYVLGIDGKGKVIRRVNEDGTTKTTQVEEEANDLTIFLDEGNNILKIESYYANLEVKYIEKNAYTDTFATEVQMNSTITQTAQEIETNVNKKLENYSTTEEMNSTIEQTAESIQSNVNKKLEDYSTTEEMNSTITQTAETINTEVSKKAGKNEVCSIVSQSADAINIKANRISIESTNFKLSKEGAIEATEGEIGGFQLGTNTFLTNFSGLYDYNEYDLRLAMCEVMEWITADNALFDILDANSDNIINSGDFIRILNIILGKTENTKNISGTLEINTQNPKNNIAIKKDGQLVVGLGAGGVNTNILTAGTIVAGYATETDFDGVTIDGRLKKITIVDNNSSAITISTEGIHTPYIATSEDIDVGGNLLVDTGVIHSLYTYEHDNTTTSPNMYISSYGNIRRTTNTSSRRYKTEVKDIEDENLNPENLYKLKIRQFKYKTDYFSNKKDERYNKNLIGFIAEEVADIFPVAADYETDKNGNKYVENWNEKYIIPAMLKLIQDQHIEIEELKKRVEKLEGGV